MFPRELTYKQKGHVAVRVWIEELSDLPADLRLDPLAGEVRRLPRECSRLSEARVVRYEIIQTPAEADTFAARFVVGADGRLHDLVITRSAGLDLDRYFQNRLLMQEWQPARCDEIALDSTATWVSEERLSISVGDAVGPLPFEPREH